MGKTAYEYYEKSADDFLDRDSSLYIEELLRTGIDVRYIAEEVAKKAYEAGHDRGHQDGVKDGIMSERLRVTSSYYWD